ncbi:MAG: hypothetical protein A3G75_02545 [Verrucomicrobia bacterium RIFCSPLOWO2_12_FULL_64_8]|nr:MAG: hypothetical protein A3G75_02545 [Verrucomicrobia bacterium RIFCSPLOWO2_12_FULL_64_8]
MKIGNFDGIALAWQPDTSIWRVELFAKTYWGQRRTQIWLGRLFFCAMWPFGRISDKQAREIIARAEGKG